MTAHHVLFLLGRLTRGERVLIHAAAGGVGTIAVQLAKRAGAIVVASASAAKHALLRELGADFVVDSRGDVLRQVKASVGEVDLVLEMIGGTDSYKRSLAALRARGRMVVFGAASGDTRGTFEPIGLMGKNLSIMGYHLEPFLSERELCAPALREITELAAAGALRVVLGGTYSMTEAAAAFTALGSRSTSGKLILKP